MLALFITYHQLALYAKAPFHNVFREWDKLNFETEKHLCRAPV